MRSAIKLRSYSATAPWMRDQQLIMRIATHGLIHKLDLTSPSLELLHEEHLMHIRAARAEKAR